MSIYYFKQKVSFLMNKSTEYNFDTECLNEIASEVNKLKSLSCSDTLELIRFIADRYRRVFNTNSLRSDWFDGFAALLIYALKQEDFKVMLDEDALKNLTVPSFCHVSDILHLIIRDGLPEDRFLFALSRVIGSEYDSKVGVWYYLTDYHYEYLKGMSTKAKSHLFCFFGYRELSPSFYDIFGGI